MNIDYPFHFDHRGRTALTDDDDHIRDMIEQVLFTTPGERVNRPTFGSGLLQLLFAPNSGELATATQFLVQGSRGEGSDPARKECGAEPLGVFGLEHRPGTDRSVGEYARGIGVVIVQASRMDHLVEEWAVVEPPLLHVDQDEVGEKKPALQGATTALGGSEELLPTLSDGGEAAKNDAE